MLGLLLGLFRCWQISMVTWTMAGVHTTARDSLASWGAAEKHLAWDLEALRKWRAGAARGRADRNLEAIGGRTESECLEEKS